MISRQSSRSLDAPCAREVVLHLERKASLFLTSEAYDANEEPALHEGDEDRWALGHPSCPNFSPDARHERPSKHG